MSGRKSQKIEALVVKAIRRLQDVQGSTPREISNYISQEYDVPGPEIRRQVELALKRGVTYGILQRLKGGSYAYNRDLIGGQTLDVGSMECCGPRGRPMARGRKRSRRGRSGKRRRGRRGRKSRGRTRRRKSRRRRRRSGRRRSRREIGETEMEAMPKQKRADSPTRKGSQSGGSSVSGSSEEKHQDDLTNDQSGIANNVD